MAYTTPQTASVGGVATAAMWNSGVRDNMAVMEHIIVRKPSNESVTSSTVDQADDHLLFAVAANEVWAGEFSCIISGAAGSGVGGVRMRFTFPTGGSFTSRMAGTDISNVFGDWAVTTTTSPTTSFSWRLFTTGAPMIFPVKFWYTNGSTAGNVGLEWAQAVSNATATVMQANSTVWGVKLA